METNLISMYDALIFVSLCAISFLVFLAISTVRERLALYKKIKIGCDEAKELGRAFIQVFEDKKDTLYPLGAWEQIAEVKKAHKEFNEQKDQQLSEAKAQIKVAVNGIKKGMLSVVENTPSRSFFFVFDTEKTLDKFSVELNCMAGEFSSCIDFQINQFENSLNLWSKYYQLLFGLLKAEAKKDETLLAALEAFVQKAEKVANLSKIKGRLFARFEKERQRMLGPMVFNAGFFLKQMELKEQAEEFELLYSTSKY